MNVKLIQTSIILTFHLKFLTSDEIRHGCNAYTMVCRETKTMQMEMNYEKVMRALRVSFTKQVFVDILR
jgi:hypothetical protein